MTATGPVSVAVFDGLALQMLHSGISGLFIVRAQHRRICRSKTC